MKKISITFLILFLILFTAIVKNSTKRIDDEIFVKEEKIRSLKKDFENMKLEYEYLSSPEKLLSLQDLYFDNELFNKDIEEIKILSMNSGEIEIDKLSLIKKNDWKKFKNYIGREPKWFFISKKKIKFEYNI